MQFRQKKITLNSPYSSINQTLWKQKKVNQAREKENMQLRTQLYQLVQNNNNKEAHFENKLEQKYKRLYQKHKDQAAWIKETLSSIEQRNYDKMVSSVKKTQNKVAIMTKRALKLEKKVKAVRLKSNKNKELDNIPENQADPIQQRQNDRIKLEQEYQELSNEAQHLHQRNKQLNGQLINLLKIKNALRQEKKKRIMTRCPSPNRSM